MVIDTLTSAIRERYHLSRVERHWLLQGSRGPVRLRSPSRRSFGFSLDDSRSPALAFFSPNPPEGLAKVCDGMLAVLHERKLYLFAIELKSGDRGDARKQLVNGRLFWQWLLELCEQHGYLSRAADVRHISLLMWRPRERSPRKGTTTHSGENDWKSRTLDGFNACFEVKNRDGIALMDLLNEC